jgi:hypothetical protein
MLFNSRRRPLPRTNDSPTHKVQNASLRPNASFSTNATLPAILQAQDRLELQPICVLGIMMLACLQLIRSSALVLLIILIDLLLPIAASPTDCTTRTRLSHSWTGERRANAAWYAVVPTMPQQSTPHTAFIVLQTRHVTQLAPRIKALAVSSRVVVDRPRIVDTARVVL